MPEFFDPSKGKYVTANWLTHWQQENAIYFVTFRLADALPAPLLREWENEREIWLKHHPEPWSAEAERDYYERFPRRTEQWLDRGHGACLLRSLETAMVVAQALGHFEGTRYDQLAWVIMPNHVHAVFALRSPHQLNDIVHAWKSYTAHALNKLLGRSGPIWQKDYFDRLIRDEDHLARVVEYIRNNPVKAKLRNGEWMHWEKSFDETKSAISPQAD